MLDEPFLSAIRRSVAGYARIPLAAVQPVQHQQVLIGHNRDRVGTTLYKIVGKGRTILIVWEAAAGRVCWVMEGNVTTAVQAA